VAIRREDASLDRPVAVTLEHGGGTRNVVLDSGDWRYSTISLDVGVLGLLRRSHRVDIEVRDWFVPAARDSRSDDLRRFGVQLRTIRPNSN
jgi:hypothetical protein